MLLSWSEFRYYESKETLRKLTSEKLGYTANSIQCDQIISCFHMARDYYESARSANLTIAPLFLYYGVIHLAKALTLIFGGPKRKRLHMLGDSHGLEIVNPQGDKTDLEDYACRITQRGIFSAFLDTFSYDIKLAIFEKDEINLKVANSIDLADQRLTLKDLLLHIPELKSLCIKTFRLPPRTADASFRNCANGNDENWGFLINIDNMKKAELGAPDIRSAEWGYVQDDIDQTSCLASGEKIPTAYRLWSELKSNPPAHSPTIDARIYLGSQCNLLLSTWIADYAGIFILGMIVRYYPDLWVSILSRKKDSQILAIVEQFIDRNKESFPMQTLQILDKHCIVNKQSILALAEIPHGIRVIERPETS